MDILNIDRTDIRYYMTFYVIVLYDSKMVKIELILHIHTTYTYIRNLHSTLIQYNSKYSLFWNISTSSTFIRYEKEISFFSSHDRRLAV